MERGVCLPPKQEPKGQAFYTIPAGTLVSWKRNEGNDWHLGNTRETQRFDKLDHVARLGGYVFKTNAYTLCVDPKFVTIEYGKRPSLKPA